MTKRFEDEANGMNEQAGIQAEDGNEMELEQALKDFKNSVHAWSEAAYIRPRQVAGQATLQVRHRSWPLALGWAMGCLLVAGSVSGGLVERHHQQVVAQIAEHQRDLDRQRELRAQQTAAVSDEVLLAGVDSDVSRQVPTAMEPLAQMMNEDETK
jgi:hypothetical protein